MGVLLSKKQVAEKLAISTRTIDRLRASNFDFGEVRIGSVVRFQSSKIEKLMEKGFKK